MGNDVLFFPVVTKTEDELGQVEEVEEYSRMAFCEKKSTPQSEFFEAGRNGIKANCVLIPNTLDYNGESTVRYKDKVYSVYRTYERADDRIELYCEVRLGDQNRQSGE